MRKNIKYGEGAFMAFGKWQATLPEEPNYLYCTGPTGEGLYIITNRIKEETVETVIIGGD